MLPSVPSVTLIIGSPAISAPGTCGWKVTMICSGVGRVTRPPSALAGRKFTLVSQDLAAAMAASSVSCGVGVAAGEPDGPGRPAVGLGDGDGATDGAADGAADGAEDGATGVRMVTVGRARAR